MPLYTTLSFQGRVENLLSRQSRETGFEKTATNSLTLTLDGPQGDCHTGPTRKSDSRTLPLYERDVDIRNVRQLTILSVEELADIAESVGVPDIKAEWFGANIVMSGIPDLTLLPPSTRLQFPSLATIVVDLENYPCSQIAKVVGQHYPEAQKLLVKKAMHKRGVTAWGEREGDIKIGDTVKVIIPPQRIYKHT